MKYTLFSLLLCLAGPSLAADFRVLNFGESCAGLTALETDAQLRSHTDELYIFDGTHLNRPTTIRYTCANGQLSLGNYRFRFDNFADARRFFLEEQANFIVEYGVPTFDQSAKNHFDYMKSIGFTIKDEHKYALYWNLETRGMLFIASPAASDAEPATVTLEISPQGEGAMSHHQH